MPTRPLTRRAATLLMTVALAGALLPAPATALTTARTAQPAVTDAAAAAAAKLRGDLAALVAGETALDPRIPPLINGYRNGELAYFVVLNRPKTAADRAGIEALGARILRDYRSVPAYAVASIPVNVLRVAAMAGVAWLAPVEIVVALDGSESYGDQTRGTPGDVGAPPAWDAGVTGQGVRIAILDTGIDPTHPDLDDLDWRDWSNPLPHGAKIIEQRNFLGGGCALLAGVQDGHGHGTHVAGIAAGTAEGSPLPADNGKYAGVAPDAELAVGKVLTDAGAGLNSDLIGAMEWAAMPAAGPLGCGIGAHIVNMSLGTESRPTRLNTSQDMDLVSIALNRLAVQYGTLFVVAAGNSGPFIGSQLESPGSASQALSVSAAAKDWDLNHDDTYSGDACAGYQHPSTPPNSADNECDQGVGTQPSSLASLSSRGPSGDLWLRPDVAAPGYYIVSAQATGAAPIASQDINLNTRADPLYATASGTSMATPATAGSAALLLEAYRTAHGALPSGASGTSALPAAPAYALVRAALMNTAGSDLLESRVIATNDLAFLPRCTLPDEQVPFLCQFVNIFQEAGTTTVYEVRNGPTDPYVGPLGEGAGKVRIGPAITALRDGVVIYSAASGSGASAGTGPRDFQGTWQIGVIGAGATQTQPFVLHGAPSAPPTQVSFTFSAGHPSDGSRAIPLTGAEAWSIVLPSAPTPVAAGGNAVVSFSVTAPAGAAPGTYTGAVVATTSAGATLRIPVFASVPMHDPDVTAGNPPGSQAQAALTDVFAKNDTYWPSVVGSTGTGATSDWNVYAVDLGAELSDAVFRVADTASGNDTYDLYLYDASFNLVDSTHPGADVGVTDAAANNARAPTPSTAPQVLSISTPAAGRHYIVVNRAKMGAPLVPAAAGNFGSFALTLDEIRVSRPPLPTQLAYEGDFIWTVGQPARLAARLTGSDGTPVAGRQVAFTVDGGAGLCGAGPCLAVTDYRGIAQVASSTIALAQGIHEVHARFVGDSFWQASEDDAFVLVVGSNGPPPTPGGSAGKVTAGGWFVPDGAASDRPDQRVHFAFHATSPGGVAPSGEFRYRDDAGAVDLTLIAWTSMVVNGNEVALSGAARDGNGEAVMFLLTVRDVAEPGKGRDTFRIQLQDGYGRSGTLGGGNIQLHR